MGKVVFKNVDKIYPGNVHAVKDFNLEIKNKEFIVFVGPSGCGKSTVLRMVAGLEEITEGEILIDDKVVNNVLPRNRDIAMVFQNYALYPHMTVYDNIAMGLKLRKVDKKEIEKRVKSVAKSIEIEELLDRKPKALSGGQQQRVALARAIVRNPNVFLMDEPLSNLDAKLRVQMRSEIIELHNKLETTFIYVTHDQMEAMTMGTRIVVMKDGIIQQVDSPMEIYENPKNMFVASFIGTPQMNFLEISLIKKNGSVLFKIEDQEIEFNHRVKEKMMILLSKKNEYVLGIRPEHIYLKNENSSIKLKGKVVIIEYFGAETLVHLTVGKSKVLVKVPYIYDGFVGEEKDIYFDYTKIFLFDRNSKEQIFNSRMQ